VGGQTKRAHADKKGRFEVDWKAPGAGKYNVRATAKRNKYASGSKDSGGRVTAYRYAQASWYGPGLYGNRTACGQTLTSSTRGVAHKSLPCGTKLSIRRGSNEVHVRVIDRGPYVGNREFDLTEATKNDLGFGSTGQILVSK
jgi:rare lipoprotein A (peptidoglycan hydrolase)